MEDQRQITNKKVYSLTEKFPDQLPRGEQKGITTSFGPPENIAPTHFKMGQADVEPFAALEQLQDVDPGATPLFLLYHDCSGAADPHLERGDLIDGAHIFDLPEWTEGKSRKKNTPEDATIMMIMKTSTVTTTRPRRRNLLLKAGTTAVEMEAWCGRSVENNLTTPLAIANVATAVAVDINKRLLM